jgi:hypothetical protein
MNGCAVHTILSKRFYIGIDVICRSPAATNAYRGDLVMNETTSMHQLATDGYEMTRFNALRHGVLSRYTVLFWEMKTSTECFLMH